MNGMNEEIDENEFYHQDFTTASEWEIFIARMEEIIHEWKIESNKGRTPSSETGSKWFIQTENIPFADVEFTLTYYSIPALEKSNSLDEEITKSVNPIDDKYDFELSEPNDTHADSCLGVWYGLSQFIVLSPINGASVISESRIKILLSSLHIVIANINTEIPIFVQIRELWQKCYLGVYEGDGIRTNFEMVHLRRGPQHCQYLTGLLDMFRTKIMSPVSMDPVIVSVQLTYGLNDYGSYIWKQDLADYDIDNFDKNTIITLPLGVTVDPIENIVLKATWSHLPDNLIIDTENYSNFEPMQAPKWTVLANFAEQPVCLLADCLTDFIHLLNNYCTMYDILGDFAASSTPESNPLDLLTESKVPTITSVLKRAARNSLTKTRRGVAPLAEDILMPMLYYMFPDADDSNLHPYMDTGNKKDSDHSMKYEEKFKGFKTCKMDSLVWRLAIVLAQVLHTLGGNKALSHIWFEFVQEMRYRWEKSTLIPGSTLTAVKQTYENICSIVDDLKKAAYLK